MAQHPAMPLWTDALLADCGHLPDADFGLYLKLLIVMWRSPGQRLPNNNEWLARRFDRSIERVESELRPLVVEFCQSDGNWITQKRLSAEFSFVTKQRRQKIVAAKARWKKEKGDAGASEPHMPHTHTHTHTKSIHTETPTDTDPAREKSGRENGASGHDVLRPSPEIVASFRGERPDLDMRQIQARTDEWREFLGDKDRPRNVDKSWRGFLRKTPRQGFNS
jgi:uncharacterized protein YdaU (DUF1376 family)